MEQTFLSLSRQIINICKEGVDLLTKKIDSIEGKMIDLQGGDTIYGYVYSDDDEQVIEMQIKALRIIDGQLCVLMDNPMISYTTEDMYASYSDDSWYPLNMSINIVYIQTVANILECIEYL